MALTTTRTGNRGFCLRALFACLCAVAVAASLFGGVPRSSAAATGDHGSFIQMASAATPGAPAKKPCPRGGLALAGAVCNAGVFVDAASSASNLVTRSHKQVRLAPALRSALATQCCGSPLLRPPRIDA